MNKIYLFTAAFAVMASLSGCSDTELASIDTAQEKTPIGFHTVGSQMGSRATIINSSNLTTTDFKVYAFDGDGNAFMGNKDTEEDVMVHNGVHIKYDGTANAWTYANSSDLRYWPDYSLDFYAVSPATFSSQLFFDWNFNNQTRTITYSCTDEYNKDATTPPPANVDVMYAVAKGQTKTDGKVSLGFKHILSQVLFKAKTQNPNITVEINGIKFHNVQLGGNFIIPAGEPQRDNWTINGSAKTVLTVGMDGTTNVTSAGTNIFTKPMLLIPQTLTAWVPSAETKEQADNADPKHSYLEISCKIKQNDIYLIGKSGFETLFVPFSATWQPGKRYVYTLVFGGGYDAEGSPVLTPINFTATTEDWKNDDDNTTTGNDIPLYQ